MSQVTVGENEGIESALRRFKRSVAKAGIFSDLRRIRHHETPVEKYKRKLKQRSRNVVADHDPSRASLKRAHGPAFLWFGRLGGNSRS